MKENNQFTKNDTLILKGIAILIMMYHHCFCTLERFSNYNVQFCIVSQDIGIRISNFGKICVAIFTFLSAYGMTISWKNSKNTDVPYSERATKFLKKRMFNLMQGWLIIFVVCEVFCWFMDKRQLSVYTGNTARKLVYMFIDGLGLADLFGTPTLIATWWYMSLAIVLIILFPVLIMLYKKFGAFLFLGAVVVIPRVFDISYEPVTNWILTFAIGMVCADLNLLVRIKKFKLSENRVIDYAVKFAASMILLAGCFYFREMADIGFFYEFRHTFVTLLVIYMSYVFICDMPYLKGVLAFFGKHSMNIFLIHSFIRTTYFEKFIYGFKYPLLIISVLFAISLCVSIVIERLKAWLGYNKLVSALREKYIV